MSNLRMGRRDVSRRVVWAFVLVQLNKSRARPAAATAAVQAFAAQTGLIEVALIRPGRNQQALRRLGRLEVPTRDCRTRGRRIHGTAAGTAGLALHDADRRL